MKFKGRILILLSSFFFLCSFTNNSGSIYVEWHAFTSYVSIDENGNRSEEKSGAGHSFVVFKNNTNRSMTIGYKTISPGEYLSVGLWNGVSAGTSSSGSSDSQSSSGSSNASSALIPGFTMIWSDIITPALKTCGTTFTQLALSLRMKN